MTGTTVSVDADETRLRQQVAAATRILQSLGVLGYSGHISVRTGTGATFLVQPRDTSRARLAPDDLCVLDLAGTVVAEGSGVPPAEKVIHTAILKARPDVGAVFHFHPENATLLTLAEGARFVPVKNHAFRWRDGVPVHGHAGHVKTDEDGAALAAAMGPHHACLLRAHGAVVVAEDVPSLMVDAIHFEENAAALIKIMSFAKPKPMTDAEMDDMAKTFNREVHVAKLWDYYLGMAREQGAIPADWDRLSR